MGTLLNGSERILFDGVAQEVMRLVQTNDPILWKFVSAVGCASVSGTTDCLYEEPIQNSKHYIPYKVPCFFESKVKSDDVDEAGLVQRVDGTIHFVQQDLVLAKVPLDEQKNHLSSGDIIQLWSKNKVRTWYFEIVSVNREGWQNDSDNFTHYVCDVIRNESFTPERKIVK